MHEDLGHVKTKYAFRGVFIWCHDLAISSVLCMKPSETSIINHKHSMKSGQKQYKMCCNPNFLPY